MIFLDANVPLYAAGRDHPLKAPCLRILEAAANRPEAFTTDAEVFQELLHVAMRQGRPLTGRTPLANLSEIFGDRVLSFHGRDVLLAAELGEEVGPGLHSRDLIHLAVMQRHGIEHVVSADRAFEGVPDVTRLDPARLAEWEDPAWFT